MSARQTSPMDDAGFFSVVLSYKVALVSPNRTLAVLRCSAPDQALAVRCLEWCASRPSTLPLSPAARRNRCCPVHYLGHGHHQMLQRCVEVADCRLRLRGTFHRSSTLRGRHSTHPHLSAGGTMLSVYPFFGALGTNRLVLGNSRVFKSQDFCRNLKAEADSCKAGK